VKVYDYLKTYKKATYSEIEKNFGEEGIIELTQLLRDGKVKIDENEKVLTYVIVEEAKNLQEQPVDNPEEIKKEAFTKMIENTVGIESGGTYTIFNILDWVLQAHSVKGNERAKLITQIWFKLPIEKIFVYRVGEKTFYKFVIDGKEIELNENEMLSTKSFRIKFLQEFNVWLPKLDAFTEGLWIMYQKVKAEKEEFLETLETEKDLILDAIKDYIETSFVSENLEETFRRNVIFVSGDEIYIPNQIVNEIANNATKTKHGYKKIAKILKDVGFLKTTKVMRVGERTGRFWIFDKNKFSLKEKVEENGEEKNESEKTGNSGQGG
jgi:hypothetical protein